MQIEHPVLHYAADRIALVIGPPDIRPFLGEENMVTWGITLPDLSDLKISVRLRPVISAMPDAKTRQPLTPRTDPNWMWLLIDADQNPKTGWEGYDFILNRTMDGKTTWLEKNAGGWKWEKVAKVEVVTSGDELMLAVPRQALGLPPGDAVRLDFKWWDNAQKPGAVVQVALVFSPA